MKIHAKIWLETDGGKLLLGEGRLDILKTIDRAGSISAAARELGMSYRAVWGKVRATEERLGVALVEGTAGGPKHGGAHLTEAGRRFIARFEDFDNRARGLVEELAEGLIRDVARDVKQGAPSAPTKNKRAAAKKRPAKKKPAKKKPAKKSVSNK